MGLTHQSLVSPCHSLFPFLSFSLCSSFRMTPWNTGALLAFCVNQGRSSFFLFYLSLIAQAVILRVPLYPARAGPRHCQYMRYKRHRFDPWTGKIPWRRACHPTPVFLPGESYGHRRLEGYSPQGCKKLDTTEANQHVVVLFIYLFS